MSFTDRDGLREIVFNKWNKELLEKRGLSQVEQYARFRLNSIDVESEDFNNLNILSHIFETGDKLYKISYKHYGNAKYWWVLAWFNLKPTDFHCKIGDTIYIPLPLDEAIYMATREE